ncbi:hypothetical protein SAMN04488564_106478 [Lentzea waywayandensis]|uniref:Uncharacterized protein n=1 Tax=Lentzea waywayandensis TaxID=84724 RepID=A0A1I6EZI3_9PSEU|nr:TetR family transcriptional regulator C-terminal domain-containing protein [Lentzea waywayandensis]SFR23110.1 hypothetical protein SAMN04488564_106478 [Lentzea waywayandensis]
MTFVAITVVSPSTENTGSTRSKTYLSSVTTSAPVNPAITRWAARMNLVVAAFLAQAVVEPRLGESLRRGNTEMVAWLAGTITAVRPGGDPERDAMALLAFAAEGLVDHQLARVLTRG